MQAVPTSALTLPPETREFIATLFLPADLVELRLIETWSEAGKHRSRFVDRSWVTPDSLESAYPALTRENQQGANIFYGVNPRSGRGSKKEDVALCRSLWADIDDARPGDAGRWGMLPPPTVVVDSGRGVHLYWRLNEPVRMDSEAAQRCVESILFGMYRELASDTVQDVSRLLRLPGFANVRGWRVGKAPSQCKLVEAHAGRTYDLASFRRFGQTTTPPTRTAPPSNAIGLCEPRLPATPDMRRVRGLVRLLTQQSPDRSKRDFFVVVKLLELGCSQDEVASLVSSHSKFSGNADYLRRTIDNAAHAIDHAPR